MFVSSMQQPSLVTTAITFSAILVVGVLWLTRKVNKRKVPTKWKPVAKVKNLTIYPLKSGYRMELDTIMCTEYGPRMFKEGVYQLFDRNLIIYQEKNNRYITVGTSPKISLIKVDAGDQDEFILNAPDMPEIVVRVPGKDAKVGEVRTYKDARIFMVDCGDEIGEWLSRYIYDEDSRLRLGFHDGSRRRNIYENSYLKQYTDDFPILTNAATGMYSYLCSYSLINETSVNELKDRICDENENVTAHNFRGNIIVESLDGRPHVEDYWSWVKIGDAVFYVVKPNTRCCITNLDPETSVSSKKYEPMATLKTYRQLKDLKDVEMEGKDPVMGCYMGLHKTGVISVTDTVYVGEP